MDSTTSIILTAGIFICLGLLKNFLEDIFFPPDTKTNKTNYSKKQFLTSNEKRFFEELKIIVGDNYYVYPQIATSSIFLPFDNSVARKRIDFMVFNKEYEQILAIELDDKTHEWESRKERDNFIDEACTSAGIGIIHCTLNDISNLKEKLDQYLK